MPRIAHLPFLVTDEVAVDDHTDAVRRISEGIAIEQSDIAVLANLGRLDSFVNA